VSVGVPDSAALAVVAKTAAQLIARFSRIEVPDAVAVVAGVGAAGGDTAGVGVGATAGVAVGVGGEVGVGTASDKNM
jgi:hypothetical protein